MKNPVIVHLLVALVWLFLSGKPSAGNFFVALVATYALLSLFRKALGCESYIRRMRALLVFLARFIQEIIHSNLTIMRMTLRRNVKEIHGEFVDYDVTDLTEFEILFISYCIGLSPGTMVADRTEDGKTLILHIYGIGDPDHARSIVDRTLKYGILAFTR